MGHLRRDCNFRGVRALDKYDLALISHLHTTLNSVMGTYSSTSTHHQCWLLRIFWTLLLKSLLLPNVAFSLIPTVVLSPEHSSATEPLALTAGPSAHILQEPQEGKKRKKEGKGKEAYTGISPVSFLTVWDAVLTWLRWRFNRWRWALMVFKVWYVYRHRGN